MRFPSARREEMRRMGEAAYPNEGCGILIGRPGVDAEVTEVRPGTNLREPQGRARDRYILAPREILAAERDADAAGLEILGFWHTHPDHPSRASAYDAEHAWPGYVYVIMSVLAGHCAGEQAWVLESESPPVFREENLLL